METMLPNRDGTYGSQYHCCMCGDDLVMRVQSDPIEGGLRVRRIFRCKHCRCDRFYEEGWK